MDPYEGFDEFVQAYGSALSRTAYLLTGDHQMAQDLLQAALARTAGHWRRVRDGGHPAAYVRRAMVNERTSWWRRRRIRPEHPTDRIPDLPALRDEADRTVRRMVLRDALARLTARQRAVLVFRFYEDLSEAETAELLGVSVGTVKSQTHAALRRLRTHAPELAEFVEEPREALA